MSEFCFKCIHFNWDERYCTLGGETRGRHDICDLFELHPDYDSSPTTVINNEGEIMNE